MSVGTYAAPPEVGGRSARARSFLLGRTALCGALTVACAAVLPQVAEAGPQGTVVVGGTVDIRQSGTHTEFTQASNTALLEHRSFDIGAAESVHFAQPSSSALAVNRVVGSDLPTSIAGKLTANGNVWVLNPSGVAIRGTAQVNVGGLLATTASISDEAILAGEHSFAGAPAGSAVTNAGTVAAGQGGVVLVAPVVSNTGTIATHGGDVALGAGSGFTVDFDGDGLTRFEVGPGSGVGLTNAGTVRAEGGAAYLSAAAAGAVQDAVVSIGGRVEATRVETRGGVIYVSGGNTGVTEIGGTLDASQAQGAGGRIAVTGDRVDIRPDAVIDASGAASGGTVEVGGGYRGKAIASPVLASAGAPATAPLPTARRTVVRGGAHIAANGGVGGGTGDGGTVIVWADEAAGFRGAIEARGGAAGGDGGFAEVSGKRGLAFDGAVDLSAPAGATGTLLLDPDSVTIVAGDAGSADQDAVLSERMMIGPDDLPVSFTISAGGVAASVGAANTVIHATDTITQLAAVTLSGDNGLTYRTETGDIRLEGSLSGPGNALTIDAGGSVLLSNLALAGLDVTAGGAITQSAAIDVSGEARFEAGGNVTLANFGNDFSTVELFGRSATVADRNAVSLGEIEANALTVLAGGAVSQAAGTIAVPGATVIETTSGGIALARATNDFADEGSGHAVSLQAPGDIRMADRDSIALGASTGRSLEVAADDVSILGVLDFNGTVELANGAGGRAVIGAGTVDGDPSAFDVTDAEIVRIRAPRLAFGSGAGGLEVQGVTLDAVSLTFDSGSGAVMFSTAETAVSGDLSVSGGSIGQTAAAPLRVDGRTNLSGGTVTLDAAANDFGADGAAAEVDAAGNAVTLVDRNAIALGEIRAGSLEVRAGGSIIDTPGKAIEVTGTTNLAAGIAGETYDIALDEPARHDFRGAVSARGEDIVLHDRNAIVLGSIQTNEGGAGGTARDSRIALYDDNGDGVLDASDPAAAGDLTVRARGTIGDTGRAIEVEGRTRLEAVSGATRFDITLDGGGGPGPHDFDSNAPGDAVHEVDAVGRNITLADRDAIALGDIRASGDLSVAAGGSVTDTAGEAIIVGDETRVVALAPGVEPSDDDFFDIVLDNAGLHEFGSIDLIGENVRLVDRQDLAIRHVDSRNDASPDPTLAGDGIFLQVTEGDFAFETGPGSVPLLAARSITLSAPNGSFDSSASIPGKDLPDGLTFRSKTGDITLDLQDGFVVQDVSGTVPFTLDAPNGISRIRIGEGTEGEFLGIGTADFLRQAQQPDFNPLFNLAAVGDLDLLRVTGDFALLARSPLTVRVQNTLGTANEGGGTTILGTSYLGGAFAGVSVFGSFRQSGGTIAALKGFRDAVEIGEIPFLIDQTNTVNGCAILVPSSCQPIGSLLPTLGYQDGLLLGIRFVAPTQDLDDPFTNRGDEEEWE